MQETYFIKVVIVGSVDLVGKTCLMQNYFDGTFQGCYSKMTYVDFLIKSLDRTDCSARMQIFDTSGNHRFRPMISSYLRRADGLMVVFDITNDHSFQDVLVRFHDARLHCNPDCIKLLVGNKANLANERRVDAKAAEQVAAEFGAQYIETSAKTSTNVKEAFELLADGIIAKKKTSTPNGTLQLQAQGDEMVGVQGDEMVGVQGDEMVGVQGDEMAGSCFTF